MWTTPRRVREPTISSAAVSTGTQSSVQSRSGAVPIRTQPLTNRARMSSSLNAPAGAVARDERRTIDGHGQPARPGLAARALRQRLWSGRTRECSPPSAVSASNSSSGTRPWRERRMTHGQARHEVKGGAPPGGQRKQIARADDIRRAQRRVRQYPVHLRTRVTDRVDLVREMPDREWDMPSAGRDRLPSTTRTRLSKASRSIPAIESDCQSRAAGSPRPAAPCTRGSPSNAREASSPASGRETPWPRSGGRDGPA